MIVGAPESHRPILSVLLSTQLWQLFRDDCLEENLEGRLHEREEQVQLFCECVEAVLEKGEKGSCADVLYPDTDIAQQLHHLTNYEAMDDGHFEEAAAVEVNGCGSFERTFRKASDILSIKSISPTKATNHGIFSASFPLSLNREDKLPSPTPKGIEMLGLNANDFASAGRDEEGKKSPALSQTNEFVYSFQEGYSKFKNAVQEMMDDEGSSAADKTKGKQSTNVKNERKKSKADSLWNPFS
mmetsp:Transcript_15560/g.21991  ORF Transcript_15560/g.21991 Transcript_15560/m.21991 type:complete len:242 (+) Transcript_15560:670-1395(+)